MTIPAEGFYRWAVREFGPGAYHRPEFYARCAQAYLDAHAALQQTPAFTTSDRDRLATVQRARRDATSSAQRRRLMDEAHALEARKEAYRKANARLFGAEMDLNRAMHPDHGVTTADRVKADKLLHGRILDHQKRNRSIA